MNEQELQQLARNLRPLRNDERQLQSKVDKIINVLEQNSRFSVAEVLPAGSLIKNTILKGHLEADIVFLINRSKKRLSFEDVLDELYWTLKEEFRGAFVKKQQIAVSLYTEEAHDLPKFDVLVGYGITSPKQMAEVKNTKFYRASTSKFHVEYVKAQNRQNQHFSDVVRLLKHWKQENKIPLSGFQLELLAADGVHRSQKRNLTSCLQSTYRTIQGFCDGKIILPVNWKHFTKKDVSCSASKAGLLLVDPGDPSNNVARDIEKTEVRYIQRLATRKL